MNAIRRVWRGLFHVPGYGPHPGLPMFAAMVVLGGAGAGLGGALWMAAFLGPVLLVGAWERGG